MAAAAFGLIGLGLAGGAQARSDVYWSVGVGAPGAQVLVGNAPPFYGAPAPVVVHRPPVVYYPPPPVYYGPPPVVYAPRPVYYVNQPRWVGAAAARPRPSPRQAPRPP